MLLLEAALEDELVVAVDGRAGGTQLSSEEGQQMLGLTMQPENDQQKRGFTVVCETCPSVS